MYKESKIEKLVKRYFKTILIEKKVLYNHRPNWLKNPKTGYNLELDIYYPDLKFAVEVDGFVHEISKYQQEKDRYKDMICKERGIYLMRVKGTKLLLKRKYIEPILKRLKIKYDLKRLSKSFKRKLSVYGSGKHKKLGKRYNKIKYMILKENKTMKIYENYQTAQEKETAGNLARMKNKKPRIYV